VDTNSLNPDPDPAFPVKSGFRIHIHGFDNQKLKKKNPAEILLKIFFCSKIAIYLSIGLHRGRLSYRRSLQPSKENIQYFKK
jgi:hypothetical protein